MDNSQALQCFEAYLRRRYPDRRTPVDYVSDVRQFHRACAKPWDSVVMQDIDAFVDQMHCAGLKPTTIKRRLAAVKVYFDFLAEETGQLDYPNPVRLKRHAGKLGRRLPRDLSDAEVARLLAVIHSARDQAMVALMLGAGLRVSEVVALTLDALIPAPTPELPVRVRVLGKGQKERIVYLTPDALALLEAWLRQRPPTEVPTLFLNQHGQPLSPSGVEWLLKRYGEQVGLHLTPHRLRHTFARRLTEARMPVESLARLMGHAQISTTQIYLASADPTLRDTFDQAMQRLATSPATPPDVPALVAVAAATITPTVPVARPAEPHYPPPDGTTWATDLPDGIRQACLGYVRRHEAGWRLSQRRERTRHVLGDFARFFRFVLERRSLATVTDLTRADMAAYVDALVARGLKPKAVRDALSRPLGLLHELQEQGESISPSLFRVELPRVPDALPRALSENEAQCLEAQARVWLTQDTPEAVYNAAWFFVLAHTGLRACELLDLRQEDVDLAQRRLCVRQGKGDRDRVVYLSEIAAQAVHRYLALCPHPEQALLFVHPCGRALSYHWVYSRLRDLGEAAQVGQVTPHRLRHTFATRLNNSGVPITSLQKLMGHDHLSTTQIYTHVYDETVERDYRQAMARLQRATAIAVPLEWFAWPVLLPAVTETLADGV
jgi:site-specific recombinase XerD